LIEIILLVSKIIKSHDYAKEIVDLNLAKLIELWITFVKCYGDINVLVYSSREIFYGSVT